jgi:hypothetical protein
LKRHKSHSGRNDVRDHEKRIHGALQAHACYAGLGYLRVQKDENTKRQKSSASNTRLLVHTLHLLVHTPILTTKAILRASALPLSLTRLTCASAARLILIFGVRIGVEITSSTTTLRKILVREELERFHKRLPS